MGVRQGRHELEERRVVVMERSDVVGVDEGAGEVDAGDAASGALEQARKLEPAPGAVAGTVHQDKVLLRGLGNIAAGVHLDSCVEPVLYLLDRLGVDRVGKTLIVDKYFVTVVAVEGSGTI